MPVARDRGCRGKRGHGNTPKHSIRRGRTRPRRSPSLQHPLRVYYQRCRSIRETHASPISFKQRLPEFAFELRNLLRHGRVRHMQGSRRGINRSARRNNVEDTQALKFEF